MSSTIKAYNNSAFLNSPEARLLRINCEYEEPRSRLRKHGIEGATIFFGSARSKTSEQVKSRHRALTLGGIHRRSESFIKEMEQLDRITALSHWHDQTTELARRLTEWDIANHSTQKFPVCSGGGPGIMEAANKGAYDAGGISIGFGISLPFEQENNDYITPELNFEFHYFFMRKFWLMTIAKGIVASPGGVGTTDEVFEFLTLRQTGKIDRDIPTVLFGKDFWEDVLDFDALKDWGVIGQDDDKMFLMTNSVDEALDHLVSNMKVAPVEY